jgi:hypothetical protein
MGDLPEELRRAAPERDEGDPELVEAAEVSIGRQARVEDEVAGIVPVVFLPEGDKAEDLLGLLSLAKIRVGVAECPTLGVLREKGEHTRLPAAPRRHVVPLHLRVLAVVGHGVEVKIEGLPGEEPLLGHLPMPGC